MSEWLLEPGSWHVLVGARLDTLLPDFWNSQEHLRQLLRVRRTGADAQYRDAYVFDLDVMGRNIRSLGSSVNDLMRPIAIESLQASEGANTIAKMDTPGAMTSFARVDAPGYASSNTIQSAVLLPLANQHSPYLEGEQLIYDLATIPALPCMLGIDDPFDYILGPTFATNVTFSVSGKNALSPVQISVSFKGGRTASFISPSSYEVPASYFRTATMQDCGWYIGEAFTVLELQEFMSRQIDVFGESLIGMELTISQDFDMRSVSSEGNRHAKQGIRFAALSNRTVTGKLQFSGRNKAWRISDTVDTLPTALTMYFGGPFLFTMPVVEWQPRISAFAADSPDDKALTFMARLPANVAPSYRQARANSELYVSEFARNVNDGYISVDANFVADTPGDVYV